MYKIKSIGQILKIDWPNLVSKIPKFKLPEKFKGGRLEKLGDYWIIVGTDYREAFLEIARDCRRRPIKASFYFSVIYGIGYAIEHNPDENEMQDCLQRVMNDSALLGSIIRNPEADKHFNYLVDCFNHNLIRRLSFGIGSVLWIDNYPPECGIYKASCSYLKPRYLTFHERIIDVGFCGIWWNLRKIFENFDVNPDEWKNKVESSDIPIIKEEESYRPR